MQGAVGSFNNGYGVNTSRSTNKTRIVGNNSRRNVSLNKPSVMAKPPPPAPVGARGVGVPNRNQGF